MNLKHFFLLILCLAPVSQGTFTANSPTIIATQLMCKGFVTKLIYNTLIKKHFDRSLSIDTYAHVAMYFLMIFAVVHSGIYKAEKDPFFSKIWFVCAATTYLTAQNMDTIAHSRKKNFAFYSEIMIKSLVPLLLQFKNHLNPILFA